MTASWLPIFVSAEPSQTILLIDRSEPRFESLTGGKTTKTWKTGYFAFKWKKNYFCWMLTDDARHKNVPPPLDLTRTLKSYHKRNDRRKFPEKEERPISCQINHAAWLVKNGKTLFSKLTQKIS